LNKLNQSQLVTEICYLRATVCPDIRQKQRVKTPDGSYRYEILPLQQLRASIKMAINPEGTAADDNNVNKLLMDIYK